jgi:hypothetical protein
MKEPNRLLESSDSEVERLLLRAGRDHAPRGAKRRALAAATGALAATTLTAGNAAGAAIAGKATAGATSVLSLKWIVVVGVASVGMVAGTAAVHAVRAERAASAPVVTSGSATTRPHASRASLPAPPESSVAPVAATVPAPSASAMVVSPPVLAPAPPPPPVALSQVRPVAPPSKPAASTGSTSAAELAMLDDARGAISGGDPQRGLAILGAYGGRFPHGLMGPEAAILRIEALVSSGDRAQAKREGDAFLRANPTSPYASRVESLVGSSNP